MPAVDAGTPQKQVKKDGKIKWEDELSIEFSPAGKKPGTLSYDRYEGYRPAKTVGEAMKLGARRADFQFDYDRGLLKILDAALAASAPKPVQAFMTEKSATPPAAPKPAAPKEQKTPQRPTKPPPATTPPALLGASDDIVAPTEVPPTPPPKRVRSLAMGELVKAETRGLLSLPHLELEPAAPEPAFKKRRSLALPRRFYPEAPPVKAEVASAASDESEAAVADAPMPQAADEAMPAAEAAPAVPAEESDASTQEPAATPAPQTEESTQQSPEDAPREATEATVSDEATPEAAAPERTPAQEAADGAEAAGAEVAEDAPPAEQEPAQASADGAGAEGAEVAEGAPKAMMGESAQEETMQDTLPATQLDTSQEEPAAREEEAAETVPQVPGDAEAAAEA